MIGRTISHYEILAEIGGGGMGVVYKAKDTKLERPVALKFLPPELTRDPDAKRRFVHEAKAASALQHHNICTIHEIDETDDGGLFICMDCYEGHTLKQRIAESPVPIEAAIDIVSQIAAGLSKAHEAGMVHRDIKPANVMITSDGVVKIVDFGLAKLAGQTKLTKSGMTVGTVAYMSPEQAKGDAVDHRTDIWSLGVVLYELVTGQLPFKSDYDQAVVYSILNDVPESIKLLRSEAPDELERIVSRAMEKQPEKRYQHTNELVADLAQVRDIVSRKTPSSGEASRHPKRTGWKRRAGGLGLGIAVAAVAAYLVLSRFDFKPKESPPSGRKMIAVLPFENLGIPEDDYFADGITDEILTKLTTIPEIVVIARESSFKYRGEDHTIAEIGKQLNVGYILKGAIRWQRTADGSSRIRVTPRLVSVAENRDIWAVPYDRELQDIFAIQTDIAVAIIQELGVTLLDRQRRDLEARPTENMDAYQAYLRAVEHARHRSGRDREAAQWWFERAVELDPGFALAYAGLTDVHSAVFLHDFDRPQDRMVMAKEAADNALRLDPALPDAHMALGSYFYRCEMDYDKAMEQYEIARKNQPEDAHLLRMIANVQRQKGEWEASLATYKKAFELDPRSSRIPAEIAHTFMFLRRYEEAVFYWDRVISRDPQYLDGYFKKTHTYWLWHGDTRRASEILDQMQETPQTEGHQSLFRYFFWQELFERNYDSALQLVDSLPVAVFEDWWVYLPKTELAGLVHYFKGETELARASFDSARAVLEVAARNRPDNCRVHSALGIAYAGLGKKDDAIREGKLAVELCPPSLLLGSTTPRIEDLAFICVLVGEYDAALEQIEYLLSIPSWFSVGLLALDPKWDPLRDHPRYQELLERYSPKESNTDT